MLQRIRQRMRLRGSAIAETMAMILAVLIIDFAFADGTRFRDLSPHPLWIPVLLVAVQYGAGDAVVSAALCSLALWIGNLPPPPLDVDRFHYLATLLATPILWLGAAIILGEIRSRHRDDQEKAEQQLARCQKRETEIAEACDRLLSQRDALQRRLAGNLHTSLAAVEALSHLEQLDTVHILATAQDIVATTIIRPDKFSLFLLENDALQLHSSHGWSTMDAFEASFQSTTPLFQHLVGTGKSLCCVSKEHEAILASQGLLASPLINRATGAVLGMIKIEALPFTDLNITTVKTLEGLCDWISRAYSNALDLERAQSNSLVATENNLFSSRFYQQQLELMTALARRAQFQVSELLIDLDDDAHQLALAERTRLANHLHNAVVSSLRKTDQAFDTLSDSTRFTILLPNTPLQHVGIVQKQIEEKLGEDLTRYRFSQQAVATAAKPQEGSP